MKLPFLLMLSKHGSELCIITNFHPFTSSIVVSEFHFIMQTPRIWTANYLAKLSKTPITVHCQQIIEPSLEFLLFLCIHDVPVPSNVHQESKPQLHPKPPKATAISTPKPKSIAKSIKTMHKKAQR
jgi:hypothetical protein